MLAEKTASTYQRRSLYEYDTFGTPENYSNTDPNSFLYAGQFYDRESESYYRPHPGWVELVCVL